MAEEIRGEDVGVLETCSSARHRRAPFSSMHYADASVRADAEGSGRCARYLCL